MGVKFTQFLRPSGERKTVEIDGLAMEVEGFAAELAAAGWRLEIEVLRTGQVHADVCNEEGQLASFIEDNGHKIPPAIEALLRQAHGLWVEHGRLSATLFDLKAALAEADEL